MKHGLIALVVLAAALPAAAHHSFPAQYDIDKPITLTGTVTKVEWTNPHIFIYADVAAADGTIEWSCRYAAGSEAATDIAPKYLPSLCRGGAGQVERL